MFLLYESIIEPILDGLRPRVVVEIGSETGATTRKLIEFCGRSGALLHAVDPNPGFDPGDWPGRYGGRAIFHRTTGLDALSRIAGFDAVLIDGDHNWYTVYHELKQVEATCANSGHPFPLILLHDVGWPYGRRDQYYHPESIPAEFRQPHAKRGMRPGSGELLESGGFNYGYWNGLFEGGPRNGVLTAVEDFVRESGDRLELTTFPGFHGLGILASRTLIERNEALARFLGTLNLTEAVRRHIEGLEANRIDLAARLQESQPPPGRLGVWKGRLSRGLRLLGGADRDGSQNRRGALAP